MTKKEEEPQEVDNSDLYKIEEIAEMLENSFLPKIQEIAKRLKEKRLADKEVYAYRINLLMQFSDLDNPLNYEAIKDQINIQLNPIFQEDVDRMRAEAEEKQKNEDSKED